MCEENAFEMAFIGHNSIGFKPKSSQSNLKGLPKLENQATAKHIFREELGDLFYKYQPIVFWLHLQHNFGILFELRGVSKLVFICDGQHLTVISASYSSSMSDN